MQQSHPRAYPRESNPYETNAALLSFGIYGATSPSTHSLGGRRARHERLRLLEVLRDECAKGRRHFADGLQHPRTPEQSRFFEPLHDSDGAEGTQDLVYACGQ